MSSQRDWTADAYPTRRQLREAARAADSRSAPLTRRQIRARERAEAQRVEAERAEAQRAETEQPAADRPAPPSAGSAPEQVGAPSAPSAPTAPEPAPTAAEPAAAAETDSQVEDRQAEDDLQPATTGPELPEEVAARAAVDVQPSTDLAPADTTKSAVRDTAAVRSRGSDKPAKSPARRWLPRLAVLGALAALTTVVPLTGAALPTSSSDPSTGTPLAETSALDVFSSGGTQISPDASAALAAEPLASVRSMVAASRSDDRGSTCATGAMEANGVLASEVEMELPEVMMPLAEGSYHYTSRYGVRSHPIFGSYGQHTGLDMAAAAGTPIHAVADGTVVHAGHGMDGRSSMLVILEHEVDGQPIWTWYVHMYPNGVYVSEGQQVSAGEAIGAVGSYGNSTGPHLHFEVHLDQAQTTIDPEAWLASNAAALDSETLQCAEG